MTDYDLESIARAYDDMSGTRAAAAPQGWKIEEVDSFLALLPPGATVLDMGAGPGPLAVHMLQAGVGVVALDISPANVEACRERGIEARVCDFMTDDLGGPYDGIVAMSTLLHVPKSDWASVVGRMAEALEVGGLALICVWGGPSNEEIVRDERSSASRFFASYADDEFAALPTPGFEKIEVRIRTEPGRGGSQHPQVMVLRRT